MRCLNPTQLIWPAVAFVLALAAPAALAVPPTGGPGAAPGNGAALATAAARPLPTLVPPENDAFTSASFVTGLPFAAALDTSEATNAADDPFCARDDAATVWYGWAAPGTAWVTAHTFGSDYDTILSAYSQSDGTLTQVACNDDADGPRSQVTFLAESGHVYYFMVAGAAGGGNLELALEVVPPLPQLPVRATPHYEITPASGPGGFAWAQGARSGFRFWTLWLDDGMDPRFRVNEGLTHGFSGGFDGDKFVYQEVRGRQSTLRLIDASTRLKSTLGGVNTRHWEWHPTMSENRVLFGRRNFATRTDRVILRDRTARTSLVLDRLPRAGGRRIAEPGQVNGNYAVWYRCAPACNVFLRDIAAGTTTRVPNPLGRQQYDPSVALDGTVYLVQSGRGCGTSVRLVRHPLGGPSTVVASLAAGRDSFHTYVEDYGDGSVTVYYERVRCSNGASDIFRVVDP